MGYWWDYDEQDIVTSLESTSGPNGLLRFEYPWSNGRSVTYEADTVRMVVRKDGADYARRLRRVLVQSPPFSNLGESNCRQVLYNKGDVDYWWDYDATVSAALERGLANNRLVAFSWDWGQLKNGEISESVAGPCSGMVRNPQNSNAMRLRRVLVPDM